jgi:nicotinate-nucleotide adenylyltransferase
MGRVRRPCLAILGGSFDPVHNGHVALAGHFAKLLGPDSLRIVPAGNPWQKGALQVSAADRVEMVRLAFAGFSLPVSIDLQEIERASASYTIDTLRAIRDEVGPEPALLLLIGADQLKNLNTWRDWRRLFDFAHVCAGSRPGFSLDQALLPAALRSELAKRAGSAEQVSNSAHGLAYVAPDLAVDIAATGIRAALREGKPADGLVPPAVLDYIKQHRLYQKQWN